MMLYFNCELNSTQKGVIALTDSAELRREIKERGLKYSFIAKELGLTPYGLQKKIDNLTEFKASEIDSFTKLLKLTNKRRDEIFFASKVN